MLIRIEDDEDYLKKVMFTDEACFHVLGKVNWHNVRIWASETPHLVIVHLRHGPKVNAWCGLLRDRLVGPFSFCRGYNDLKNLHEHVGRIRLPTD